MKKILCLVLSLVLLPHIVLYANDEGVHSVNEAANPVRDVILKGELLVTEDFDDEESIDELILASIDDDMVELSDGALHVNSNGGKYFAIGPFGTNLKECIAEYDIKQLSCGGSTGANITFGMGASGQASYCFTYADVSKYNKETNALDGNTIRDRLLIGKTTGSNLMNNWSYFAGTDEPSGALVTSERKFEDFYTFRAAIAGNTAVFEMFDGDTLLDAVSVKNASIIPSDGLQTIRTQNTEFLIDNIKVYEAKGFDSITFVPEKTPITLDEPVTFKLVLGDGTQLDKKFFSGVEITADSSITIDKENCTITAAEEGDFDISVLAKDYSNPQITVGSSCSINVIDDSSEDMTDEAAVEAALNALVFDKTVADSDFELPAEVLYDATIEWESNSNSIRIEGNKAFVHCAYAETTVTLTAIVSKGTETATKPFTVIVPAIESPERDVILKGELLFTEDFNNVESVDEDIKSSIDGENIKITEDSLYINSKGQYIAISPFGSTLKECIAEYDVKQLSGVGNTTTSITFGTNTIGQASYCFVYADASKYNSQTNALDGNNTVRDRLLIGNTTGSNQMGNWSYFAGTDEPSGALLTTERKFEDFYTFRAAIAGNTALFEMFDGDTLLDAVSVKNDSIVPSDGLQIIRMQNTEFLIDNINVYEAKGIDSISFVPEKASIKPDEPMPFKLVLGDGTQLDKKFFSGVEITADSSITIDKENCTITAAEEGDFDITVFAKDYSNPQITVGSSCTVSVSNIADTIFNITNELKIEDCIENHDSILDNFVLPVEKDGATLIWQSDSEEIVIDGNNAVVTRGETDKEVILTVKVILGNVSSEKQFTVTVVKNLNDAEVIEYDLKEIKIPERTTENITLPLNGRFGSVIEWSSNTTSVISNSGEVKRETKDRTVTLKAIFKAGGERKTVYYNVIVSGKGSFSVGSSSGGSSSRDMTIVKPSLPKSDTFKFSDVDDSFWAKNAIYTLVNNGVISKDNAFRPNDNIKREEFVKMAVEMFGLLDENAQCDFNDCDKNSWYYKYIASAYQAGIISGTNSKNFGLGMFITREDMATIIARILEQKGIKIQNAELAFADKDKISDYAKNAVAWLNSQGIINGMGENLFVPKNNATRAQCAVILYNTDNL